MADIIINKIEDVLTIDTGSKTKKEILQDKSFIKDVRNKKTLQILEDKRKEHFNDEKRIKIQKGIH